MDRLIFTAAAAVSEHGLARQSMVHDLANVSTVGFKRSFDHVLRAVKADGLGFDTRFEPQIPPVNRVQLAPGPVMATGRALDLAMTGQTVLGVQAPNGELAFTRRGDLRVLPTGALENGAGHLVLGEGGGPLVVPPGFDVRISPDGSVYARDPAQNDAVPDVLVGRLLLREADGLFLMRREDGLFAAEDQAPGTDLPAGAVLPGVIPQALEGSNVNPIEAMTRLIDHARSFEMHTRLIKEAKSLDESGATMMRAS